MSKNHTTRRDFLKQLSGLAHTELLKPAPLLGKLGLPALGFPALVGCSKKSETIPKGLLQGPNMEIGHRLRQQKDKTHSSQFPAPSQTKKTSVAIIGGGVSGLSAAWRLARAKVDDFVLFELESETGGNARGGENSVSAYPFGAHYLPAPNQEARAVRHLLADLGVLTGGIDQPIAEYDERYLLFAPQERLFIHGVWQEGLVPNIALTSKDQAEYQRFFTRMTDFRKKVDSQQRPWFSIPIAKSSPEAAYLDHISMYEWLKIEDFTSTYLHWYINYTCRDDYGTSYMNTPAWLGIHYFASRHTTDSGFADSTSSNTEHLKSHEQILTWPGGNSFLTKALHKRLHQHIHTNHTVFNLQKQGTSFQVDVFLNHENRSERWLADWVIIASPLLTLPCFWHDMPSHVAQVCQQTDYAPWLTATLHLKQPLAQPLGQHEAPLSWDNVIYQGQGLGYVLANHQHLRSSEEKSILTYYHAFDQQTPSAARQALFSQNQTHWAKTIIQDLKRAHPDIIQHCEQLDIWRWPHAMRYPRLKERFAGKNFEVTQTLHQLNQGIVFAHSDLSTCSIFEEANYHGVNAAEQVLQAMLGTLYERLV